MKFLSSYDTISNLVRNPFSWSKKQSDMRLILSDVPHLNLFLQRNRKKINPNFALGHNQRQKRIKKSNTSAHTDYTFIIVQFRL